MGRDDHDRDDTLPSGPPPRGNGERGSRLSPDTPTNDELQRAQGFMQRDIDELKAAMNGRGARDLGLRGEMQAVRLELAALRKDLTESDRDKAIELESAIRAMRTAEANFSAALASHNRVALEQGTAVVNAVSGAVVKNSFGPKARIAIVAGLVLVGLRALQTLWHDMMRWW